MSENVESSLDTCTVWLRFNSRMNFKLTVNSLKEKKKSPTKRRLSSMSRPFVTHLKCVNRAEKSCHRESCG